MTGLADGGIQLVRSALPSSHGSGCSSTSVSTDAERPRQLQLLPVHMCEGDPRAWFRLILARIDIAVVRSPSLLRSSRVSQ